MMERRYGFDPPDERSGFPGGRPGHSTNPDQVVADIGRELRLNEQSEMTEEGTRASGPKEGRQELRFGFETGREQDAFALQAEAAAPRGAGIVPGATALHPGQSNHQRPFIPGYLDFPQRSTVREPEEITYREDEEARRRAQDQEYQAYLESIAEEGRRAIFGLDNWATGPGRHQQGDFYGLGGLAPEQGSNDLPVAIGQRNCFCNSMRPELLPVNQGGNARFCQNCGKQYPLAGRAP
jgi:hypothetical protein